MIDLFATLQIVGFKKEIALSECKLCTPTTLYMKIKMPHKFLPESVAMPLTCKIEKNALGHFQVTQSCNHNALKIT